jgi:hypothetical protein
VSTVRCLGCGTKTDLDPMLADQYRDSFYCSAECWQSRSNRPRSIARGANTSAPRIDLRLFAVNPLIASIVIAAMVAGIILVLTGHYIWRWW